MARITIKSLTEQLDAANARIHSLIEECEGMAFQSQDLRAQLAAAYAHIAQLEAQRPKAPAALPHGYRMLVINGIQRYASQDFAYLSQVAKKTKAAHPEFSVQIH